MHFALFVHLNSRTEVLQQCLRQFPRAGTSARWFSLFPVINNMQDSRAESKLSCTWAALSTYTHGSTPHA